MGRTTKNSLPRTRVLCSGVALLAVITFCRPACAQQTLSWSPTGIAGAGGTGTWNTAGVVWADGAVCCQAWNNAAAPLNDAVFGGTAGTVTVSGGINVHSLIFNTSGYSVTGSTLTLGGATPTITSSVGVTVTIGSILAGSAGVIKAGAGTLNLTGTNTFTGGTTISAGSLRVGSGGTTGSLGTSAVVNNGALAINRSNAFTVANDISGTGTLTQIGTGTTTLTGTNTYAGGTTISAGTLWIGNGGTTGTLGTGAVVDNAALVFNRGGAFTVAGAISGTGTLTQAGAGTTILTGMNTYAGATTISAGTLQVGNGGTTGTLGTGTVLDNGTLAFNRSDAVTVEGAVGGTGALTQIGTGITTLTGANTYTGGTTISAGTLQIGDGGTTGSILGDVTDNGTLAFNRADPVGFSGAISGTGALAQIGTGTTVLTGTNSYAGDTIIKAGTLQVGNGGTTGTLGIGAVVNHGTLVFNRSDAILVGSEISGSGALLQIGTGTTTLTGTNTYAGGTTISAGTLQIGNGGATGTLGTGAVVDNAALVFNRSDALTLALTISGAGTLTQAGPGTLTVLGAQTYTGGTFVNAGTLALDGSLAGVAAIAAGATFSGTGTVGGALTVNGTLAIGSAAARFGTLSVGGNVTPAAGSRDVVAIDALGNHSFLHVGGAASIGGEIAIDPIAGSYKRVTFYPVLDADGGLSGTATATSTNAALDPWVRSTSTTLIVTALNTELPLASYATTANGAAIGGVFDRLRRQATGDLAGVTRELTALDDPGLGRALDAVAGEIHASAIQLAALDSEAGMDLVREEVAARGSNEVTRTTPAGWSGVGNRRVWARFQAQRSAFSARAAHGADAQMSGFALGADWTRADRWLTGFGAGFTRGNLALEGLAESSDYTAPRAFGYVGRMCRRRIVAN